MNYNYDGWTPLQFAHNNEEITQFLLDKGTRKLSSDDDPHTALHLAAERGYVGVVRLHLDRGAGAYVNAIDEDGETPMLVALDIELDYHNAEKVRLLLDRDTAVNAMAFKKRNDTALHRASRCNDVKIIEMLLD